MSSAVIWECIRNHSSFKVPVRNGPVDLSRERGNLRNVATYTSSGLVHRKAVHLNLTAKGVRLSLKSGKATRTRRPRANYYSTKFEKDVRRNGRAIANVVGRYRRDLRRAALARMSALLKSKPRTRVVAKKTTEAKKEAPKK